MGSYRLMFPGFRCGQAGDGRRRHQQFEISELKWIGMGVSTTEGKNPLEGVALIVNKSLKCSTWVQSQKQQNDLGSFPRQTIQYRSNQINYAKELPLRGVVSSNTNAK